MGNKMIEIPAITGQSEQHKLRGDMLQAYIALNDLWWSVFWILCGKFMLCFLVGVQSFLADVEIIKRLQISSLTYIKLFRATMNISQNKNINTIQFWVIFEPT